MCLPLFLRSRVRARHAESRNPRGSGILRFLDESQGGSLDEGLPLIERRLHVVGDGLGRSCDQPGNSRSTVPAGPQLAGGLIEHRRELRGRVGLLVTGRQPGCERVESDGGDMPRRLVSGECT